MINEGGSTTRLYWSTNLVGQRIGECLVPRYTLQVRNGGLSPVQWSPVLALDQFQVGDGSETSSLESSNEFNGGSFRHYDIVKVAFELGQSRRLKNRSDRSCGRITRLTSITHDLTGKGSFSGWDLRLSTFRTRRQRLLSVRRTVQKKKKRNKGG